MSQEHPSQPSVLYLLNQRFPSEKAYGIQVAKTAEALVESGITLELAVPYRVNSNRDPFEYYSIKHSFKFTKLFSPDFYLPGVFDRVAFWLKNLISSRALANYARQSSAQVIYSRDELPLYRLSSSMDKKLIFEAHGFSESRKPFYANFKKNNVRIIAITQGIKDDFVRFGFPADHILVAHDGVDPTEFAHLIASEKIRADFGLPQSKPIALYVGQLYFHKGASVVAESARHCPEVTFVFVGGSVVDANSFKKNFSHEPNVFVLGKHSSLESRSLMVAADVLVLPNRIESGHTSPLKLFEYMMTENPIVASAIPALQEVLNETNSVLVEPGNTEALAHAIRHILADRSFAAGLAAQAKQDVQNYTWHKRAEAIKRFLDNR